MKLIEKIRYQVSIKSIFEFLEVEDGILGYFCPFCNEQTGAIILKETENRFKCTKCGKMGGSVDIVKQLKNIETNEAVQLIADNFNIDEDTGFEEDLLSSWKNDAKSALTSVNDFFGIESDVDEVDDDIIFKDIFESCENDEITSSYLQMKEFSDDLIEKLQLKTLVNPHLFYDDFSKKYTKTNIDNCGLFDRNREFIFQKHKVLIPFFKENKLDFLAGWDLKGGKYEFVTPYKKTIPNYFPNLFPKNENLFIVEDFRSVFTFLKKGYNAIAVFTPFPNSFLEKLKDKKISICGEKNEFGNKFNRKVIKQLTESNIDFSIGDFSPCFEDYGDYLINKRK